VTLCIELETSPGVWQPATKRDGLPGRNKFKTKLDAAHAFVQMMSGTERTLKYRTIPMKETDQ